MALDSVPAGDIAVFAICELFSLPFSFDGVERLRAGESWGKVLVSWTIALALMLLGITFPWLRRHLGVRFSSFLERLVHKRRFWLIVSALIATYPAVSGLLFFARLRSDLDTYLMPRTVSPLQADRLREYLEHHPPSSAVSIKVFLNDQEAMEYAGQLFNALRQTSWDVIGGIDYPKVSGRRKPSVSDIDAKGRPLYKNHDDYLEAREDWLEAEISRQISERTNEAIGLSIQAEMGGQGTTADPKHPTPDAVLEDGLHYAGIEVNGHGSANTGKSSITIIVGHRPRAITKEPWLLPILQHVEQWLQQ